MSVLVIGVGLIGASIGSALVRAGHRVSVQDQIPSHALVASSLGAGEVATPDPAEVELVVVAVPPDACAAVVNDSLLRYQQATVTDVASVKQPIVRAVCGDVSRFVPSHPMAGSHHSGPVTANPDLFVDRTWVITPQPVNPSSRIEQVRELAVTCGAEVVTMSAVEHDDAVAAVSHLPHVVSMLVARQLRELPVEHIRLAGQGLRDVTRVAASDPQLWAQIVTGNAAALRPQLMGLRDGIVQLLAQLDHRAEVAGLLSQGVAGTQRIPGKHGTLARDWIDVVVEIPDAPGGLAQLFADISAAGINVEDIAIEHDQVREVGFLAISVVPDGAAQLRTLLIDAGWAIRL